jgi:hypothetical protein
VIDETGRPITEGRINLGCGAVLARLNASESSRVSWRGNQAWPDSQYWWRLEVHDVDPSFGLEAVRLLIQQLALVVRELPDPGSLVYDLKIAGVWRRRGFPLEQLRPSGRISSAYIPLPRISTARGIRENMPAIVGSSDFAPIRRALDHYEESVRCLGRHDYDTALVLAALAHESLLGSGLHQDLSYRLRLRGALVAAPEGPSREWLMDVLSKLYSARSKVVHSGGHASREDVRRYQQFLMRAIPSFSELARRFGTAAAATEALDSAATGASTEIVGAVSAVGSGDGWWGYVDLSECLDAPQGPARQAIDKFWWFEY